MQPQLNPPAKSQHSVADVSSSTTRFTISFSCPWSPRPRPRPRPRRRRRGLAGRNGVNPQGQVLHRRRWVQEGPCCDAEIEAASAFTESESGSLPDSVSRPVRRRITNEPGSLPMSRLRLRVGPTDSDSPDEYGDKLNFKLLATCCRGSGPGSLRDSAGDFKLTPSRQ